MKDAIHIVANKLSTVNLETYVGGWKCAIDLMCTPTFIFWWDSVYQHNFCVHMFCGGVGEHIIRHTPYRNILISYRDVLQN
jgi:hypothetical protein